MGHILVNKRVAKGRTYIRVSLTPKGPSTKALLAEFAAGVKDFEKKWKEAAKATATTAKAKKAKKAK